MKDRQRQVMLVQLMLLDIVTARRRAEEQAAVIAAADRAEGEAAEAMHSQPFGADVSGYPEEPMLFGNCPMATSRSHAA